MNQYGPNLLHIPNIKDLNEAEIFMTPCRVTHLFVEPEQRADNGDVSQTDSLPNKESTSF